MRNVAASATPTLMDTSTCSCKVAKTAATGATLIPRESSPSPGNTRNFSADYVHPRTWWGLRKQVNYPLSCFGVNIALERPDALLITGCVTLSARHPLGLVQCSVSCCGITVDVRKDETPFQEVSIFRSRLSTGSAQLIAL
jgi:hypothetical protein